MHSFWKKTSWAGGRLQFAAPLPSLSVPSRSRAGGQLPSSTAAIRETATQSSSKGLLEGLPHHGWASPWGCRTSEEQQTALLVRPVKDGLHPQTWFPPTAPASELPVGPLVWPHMRCSQAGMVSLQHTGLAGLLQGYRGRMSEQEVAVLPGALWGRWLLPELRNKCSYGGVFLGALCCCFESRSCLAFMFPY